MRGETLIPRTHSSPMTPPGSNIYKTSMRGEERPQFLEHMPALDPNGVKYL
jgi:hypothetical protein